MHETLSIFSNQNLYGFINNFCIYLPKKTYNSTETYKKNKNYNEIHEKLYKKSWNIYINKILNINQKHIRNNKKMTYIHMKTCKSHVKFYKDYIHSPEFEKNLYFHIELL